ncbi:hypothetical protein P170DRAFT_37341 [Aspergillus steynii IBT 23096]|uniref:Uncharacterized protein n=1 Tax=Aspergillus steynii IBT 23096 TaxID=1392250 RepID=A0A2I2GQZ3_9EURO|nr:uncharacterized protein P170DRAFT_37341 [Aspergillus steynii IBT 23096]PLB55297.1 hypothetical protein P170DRAFT_37341 [Aspergillus steynii IBT 23096]
MTIPVLGLQVSQASEGVSARGRPWSVLGGNKTTSLWRFRFCGWCSFPFFHSWFVFFFVKAIFNLSGSPDDRETQTLRDNKRDTFATQTTPHGGCVDGDETRREGRFVNEKQRWMVKTGKEERKRETVEEEIEGHATLPSASNYTPEWYHEGREFVGRLSRMAYQDHYLESVSTGGKRSSIPRYQHPESTPKSQNPR